MAFRSEGLYMADGRDACRIEAKLRESGLRPTRQRLDLARLLFREGDRHVTAETLHGEAVASCLMKNVFTLAPVLLLMMSISEVAWFVAWR